MNNNSIDLSSLRKSKIIGRIVSSTGADIVAELPMACIGDLVTIELATGNIKAEVLGFSDNKVSLVPFSEIKGLMPGARVTSNSLNEELILSERLVGSLTDAHGNIIIPSASINTKFDLKGRYPLEVKKLELVNRQAISRPLWTGIRSIDTFTTIGMGQKVLMLAEPGVGKSHLLNSLCQNIQADLVIVALIGERGREVIEFYQHLIESGAEKKTIVVSSTSDSSPLLKRRAATTAIRIAEIARDQGLNVFLATDSLTRYIRALRDIGLSTGQLPVRRGYPSSVFDEIPKYIERAGTFKVGSITAIYTMLSSGEIEDDPLVEEVKGLTDGHLVLSRKLAEQGHYPALDITKSLSRVGTRFFTSEEAQLIQRIRSLYTSLREEKELMAISGLREEVTEISMKLQQINEYLKYIENKDQIASNPIEELKAITRYIT